MIMRILLFALWAVAVLVLGFALAGLFLDFLNVTFIGLLLGLGLIALVAGALFDIWRRADLATGPRLLWTLFIVFVPILGSFIYAMVRPADAQITYRGDQVA